MDWVTPVISGSAGIIGASVGLFSNLISSRSQRKLNETDRLQRVRDAKFIVYNQVLDLNGREPILEPGKGRGWRAELYLRHVRPVLFKNYHLLGAKVRRQVRTIDIHRQRKRWGLLTEEDDPDSLEYMYYLKLMELIEEEYQSFT
ncbi:hypothetical protein NZD89_08185 [Alicyclobacillus fastidiosus]|uniref:Uncharacterized protein n=1 Tax=Alicyclobacillus fastidiosus TaxID=392011 RepID=A0ABY6ZMD1_9BACL|nr:hypothetical protein [Alicyclobacillus fastidiosus]WAH43356.1 hypothetical protein NZD89_08185 [Alicyclobacillus fastidiosus]GMA65417.1 hypothetical protein GCM10025859_58570 [Alicyclobacillus fastidiosus]